jgi:CheY-like chemotaxis protein
MAITVYCVGSDAARVARALSGGRRRVSCTRLPPSVDLVLGCVRERAPDLIVLGGDADRAADVADALTNEPAAEGTLVLAWGLESTEGMALLVALGAMGVPAGEDALRRACEELLDAREGRTMRVAGSDEDEALQLHGRRVIIAEDHPAVAWYFGDTLRRAGCDVEEVHDGWTALDRARRAGPDVVLADIRMPGLDGLRLCRALRMDPVLADVPVVMLSWKDDWLVRARDADVGATAFLGKHAVPEEVVACVRQAIARHAALEARFREAGVIRGLLGDISSHRLLRLSATARPDARVTVQSGVYGFEVHLRDGALMTARRVSAAGDELRGGDALGALLTVGGGRFVVTTDRTQVEPELHGSLHQLASPHIARARELGLGKLDATRWTGAGPHPSATPSIPIVVEPTQTVKLAEPQEPSLPVPLVSRAAPAAKTPVVLAPKPKGLTALWKTLLRAVALAAVVLSTVALGADSHRAANTGAATMVPTEPAPEPPSQALPGIRAARVAPVHPR